MEDSLLTDEELDKLPSITGYPPTITCLTEFFRDAKKQVAQAQYDLTASIKDAELKKLQVYCDQLWDTLQDTINAKDKLIKLIKKQPQVDNLEDTGAREIKTGSGYYLDKKILEQFLATRLKGGEG